MGRKEPGVNMNIPGEILHGKIRNDCYTKFFLFVLLSHLPLNFTCKNITRVLSGGIFKGVRVVWRIFSWVIFRGTNFPRGNLYLDNLSIEGGSAFTRKITRRGRGISGVI